MPKNTPEFDAEQAASYLDRRFSDLEGYIATALQGREWTERFFEWPKDRDFIVQFAAVNVKFSDFYICPVLRKTRDLDKFNGLASLSVFADLDGGEIPPELNPFVEKVRSGTSGRYHLYIQLSEPTDPQSVEKLNYALKEACGADSKWSNASYLRLPGTLNHKTTPPRQVAVEAQSVPKLSVIDVGHLFKHYMPGDKEVPILPTDEDAENLRRVKITRLSPTITRLLKEVSGADRSRQSYFFINRCVEEGYTLEETYSLALHHRPTVDKFGKRHLGIQKQVIYLHNKAVASLTTVNNFGRDTANVRRR